MIAVHLSAIVFDELNAMKKIGAMGLIGGAIAATLLCPPSQAACELFAEPQQFNTQVQGDVIVIGAQADRRYQVILPNPHEATLPALRDCVTDAYLTQSRMGSYIHIGSFDNRQDARNLRHILREAGYRARVIYSR